MNDALHPVADPPALIGVESLAELLVVFHKLPVFPGGEIGEKVGTQHAQIEFFVESGTEPVKIQGRQRLFSSSSEENGPLHGNDLYPNAHGAEISRYEFRHLLAFQIPGGRNFKFQFKWLTIRLQNTVPIRVLETGLGEERFRLWGIVGVGLHVRVGVRGVHDAPHPRAMTQKHVLDDGSEINRVVQRPADARIAQHPMVRANPQINPASSPSPLELETFSPRQDGFRLIGRDVHDDVGSARLQLPYAGRSLGHRPPDHLIDCRLTPPPALVGLHLDAVVLDPFHQLVGPRADGFLQQFLGRRR